MVERAELADRTHSSRRLLFGKVRFEPIRPLRAHEYVAEQIRRHLALRLIGPGEALPPERDLTALFGVGRPTIQAALRLLEAEGLVEARRGRSGGTFVVEAASSPNAWEDLLGRVARQAAEINDLLDLRRIVEPAVAALAAERRVSTDLADMESAIGGMIRATSEPEYMRYDTEFHLALARASHNVAVAKTVEDVRSGLNDAMTLLPESETWHRRLAKEHEAVVDAVRQRDAEGAKTAMSLHVAYSEQSLRAVLAALARQHANLNRLGPTRGGRS